MFARVSIFLLALTLSGCVAATPSQERAYARAVASGAIGASAALREPHDPDFAMMISLLVPGVGHLYLREPARAIAWCVLSTVLPGCAPVAAWCDARELNRIAVAEAQLSRESEVPCDPRRLTLVGCRYCGQETPERDRCGRCGRAR